MTFTSLPFLFFLPLVFLAFHCVGARWRWLILLGASYLFYASFKAPYLPLVLLLVTCSSYLCGLRMGEYADERGRARWLWLGCLFCVSLLAVLKYLPVAWPGGLPAKIVSIGVSYFTFQAISYLVDVYLETEEPERHFGRFALYLAFFPKLLQGPIERCGDLLPQLRAPFRPDYDSLRSALLLFTWGLFKKVVLADRLAVYSDQVYGRVHDYSGWSLLVGTYAYALQLYFDFSAYTDMARGISRLFGINLTENFNGPYLATSVADFWRRWHISFSRWILDYIFKPLQIAWRQHGQAGTALALLVTFLASGIWHGANWGFVVWGTLHGVYLACSTYYRPYQKRLHSWLGVETRGWLKWWQRLVTFNLVCFAWIFFRAHSLSDACYVVANLFSAAKGTAIFAAPAGGGLLAVLCPALLLLVSTDSLFQKAKALEQHAFVRWVSYYALLLVILIFGKFGESSFVYFKF